MAKRRARRNAKDNTIRNLFLIGGGIGTGFLIFRFFTRKAKPVATAIAEGRSGLIDAIQVVTDSLFGVADKDQIVETTNVIVSQAEAAIQDSDNELDRLRLRLISLQAAKAEATALGNTFGLEPSITNIESRIAEITLAEQQFALN